MEIPGRRPKRFSGGRSIAVKSGTKSEVVYFSEHTPLCVLAKGSLLIQVLAKGRANTQTGTYLRFVLFLAWFQKNNSERRYTDKQRCLLWTGNMKKNPGSPSFLKS